MAADDLFFLRTGSEERPFVLVRLLPGDDQLQAETSLEGPDEQGQDGDFQAITDDLITVLRDASEYANLHGYDLRIDLKDQSWPEGLGILGNK